MPLRSHPARQPVSLHSRIPATTSPHRPIPFPVSLIEVDDPPMEPDIDVAPAAARVLGTFEGTQPGAPWGLDRIDSRGARDGKYSYGGATGTGVRICTGMGPRTMPRNPAHSDGQLARMPRPPPHVHRVTPRGQTCSTPGCV